MKYDLEKDTITEGNFSVRLNAKGYKDFGEGFVKVGDIVYNMLTEMESELSGTVIFGTSNGHILTDAGIFDSEFNEVEEKTERF